MPKISLSRFLPISFPAAVRVVRSRGLHILSGRDDGRARLSIEFGGTVMSRAVRTSVGDAEMFRQPIPLAALPFRIEAEEHPGWTPILLAELEVVGTGAGVEVTVDGEYRVPGSIAGSVADRLGLRRIAERSVERFFAEVLDRLESAAAAVDALTGVPS